MVARRKAAKPGTLDGITVGVLDIGKARGDVFLDRIAERLGERGVAVKRYAKPGPSRPAVIETGRGCWPRRRWRSSGSRIEAHAYRAVCTIHAISKVVASRQ